LSKSLQRLDFDLPDTLGRHAELCRQFMQGQRILPLGLEPAATDNALTAGIKLGNRMIKAFAFKLVAL